MDQSGFRALSGNVLGIFHPVISVSTMREGVVFYRDVLGLRVTFDNYHDAQAIAALFGFPDPIVHSVIFECSDGSEFELVEFERPRGRTSSNRDMSDAGLAALALRVDHVEEIVGRIRGAGYATSSDIVEQTLPDGAVLKVVVCSGPDGVTVILVEPPVGRRSLAET